MGQSVKGASRLPVRPPSPSPTPSPLPTNGATRCLVRRIAGVCALIRDCCTGCRLEVLEVMFFLLLMGRAVGGCAAGAVCLLEFVLCSVSCLSLVWLVVRDKFHRGCPWLACGF